MGLDLNVDYNEARKHWTICKGTDEKEPYAYS